MYLESPVCWPTAKLLDLLLGSNHSHTYRRNELKTLVELHSQSSASRSETDSGLSEVEVGVVTAALGLRERRIDECMKRIEEVYTVDDGMRICDVNLKEVSSNSAHSVKTAFLLIQRPSRDRFCSSRNLSFQCVDRTRICRVRAKEASMLD